MTLAELQKLLYKRAQKELDCFFEALKKMLIDEMIHNSERLVVYENTMSVLNCEDISDKRVKALLKQNNLLSKC